MVRINHMQNATGAARDMAAVAYQESHVVDLVKSWDFLYMQL